VGAHVREEEPEIRAPLPIVAGHLGEQRALPCTTSSCEIGKMKFSDQAYTKENVINWWL